MTAADKAPNMDDRANRSRHKTEVWPCVCAFAKSVGERNPYSFPRVGLSTNVLYRCTSIIEHVGTGIRALQPPTKACCPPWFTETAPPADNPPQRSE